MGRELLGGEIGCYLSHIKCAEIFLKSNAHYAVVLEDDFKIKSELPFVISKVLNFLEEERINWHLINIGNEKLKLAKKICAFDSNGIEHILHHAYYFPMTTTGLIWNRAGAQAFLEQGVEIFAPVDNYFRFWLTRTGLGLAFAPPLVTTIDAQSTIDINSSTSSRKYKNRSAGYGFIKQRRLLTDKLLALKHLFSKH